MNDSSPPHSPALTAETGSARSATIPTDAAERHWSPDRMAEFIAELAATQEGEVSDLAWGIALEQGYDRLYRAALARAVGGTEVPVYQRGELIGSRRHYDEKLTCFLLRQGKPRSAPQPKAKREAMEAWGGRFEELVEAVRAGGENA
jgi:hypothetical protein